MADSLVIEALQSMRSAALDRASRWARHSPIAPDDTAETLQRKGAKGAAVTVVGTHSTIRLRPSRWVSLTRGEESIDA